MFTPPRGMPGGSRAMTTAIAPGQLLIATFTAGVAIAALALPWLSPFATGPSSATIPWLVSLTGLATWLLCKPRAFSDAWPLVVKAWVIAALVTAVIGLVQYFGVSANFGSWINRTGAGEAFGNLRQRNQYATLTNVGLAVLLLHPPARSASSIWRLVATALLAIGNAASSSRTGMAQLVMLLIMVGIWGGLRRAPTRRVVLAAVLAYGLAILLLPRLLGSDPDAFGVLARLRHAGPECASRLVLWANVLDLTAEKPWGGWGWGELDYAHFVTLYPGLRFCDILDNAHNLPLHLAVELGVPIAVLAGGVGWGLVVQSRPWRETRPARRMAWALLALILLHSMLEYPLWYGPFQITGGLCVWILWSTRRSARPSLPGRGDAPARTWAAALPVALLAAVVYAAWDYHRVSQLYLAAGERAPAYRDNTLEKVKGSWLFGRQVRFAELTTTDVTPENAAHINALAHELLHFSPEARVVEKLIESAALLGRDDEVLAFLARYQAAFPAAHAQWVKTLARP